MISYGARVAPPVTVPKAPWEAGDSKPKDPTIEEQIARYLQERGGYILSRTVAHHFRRTPRDIQTAMEAMAREGVIEPVKARCDHTHLYRAIE